MWITYFFSLVRNYFGIIFVKMHLSISKNRVIIIIIDNIEIKENFITEIK
jgi:hypothetical protein